ncbi:MAG: hypothetical protein QOF89_4857 [Acidobacteriota bacterium]|nr:hypothetical protein [Acidobacteriota bacterium]
MARYYQSDPYPELRELLAPEYAELPPERLEAVLGHALGGGSVEDMESFWSSVKDFGRAAGGVLQTALPVVTTVAGTALGGPVGAAIGGAAGQALSGALGGALSGPNRGRGQRVLSGLAGGALQGVSGILGGGATGAQGRALPGPFGAIAGAVAPALGGLAGGGSPAAAQLARTITRPETLQALLSMVMGGAGRRQVPVAGAPVPVSAFANLLGQLASQASAEYHQTIAGESAGTPMYLLDGAGEFIGDPADPASRAEVLLRRFAEADALEAAEAYDEAWDESDERWELDEMEAEYDEFELAEAYGDD